MASRITSRAEDMTIPARDGFKLAADVHHVSDIWVVINSATGVKRRYYADYAGFLALNGLSTVCYDYRGIGQSRPRSLRGFAAVMSDWGRQDFNGVLDWVEQRNPSRVMVIGHSVGGQLMAFASRPQVIDGLMAVACQSGYWGHWPVPKKYALAGLWLVGVPLLTGLYGYFPSRFVSMGEDLPMGVARQWARWCRNRAYYQGESSLAQQASNPTSSTAEEKRREFPGLAGYRGPINSYTFSDDPFCPQAAADAFHSWFPDSALEQNRFRPHDLGVERLGHFAFFRQRFRESLWQPSLDWLRQEMEPGRSQEGEVPGGGDSGR